MLTLLVEEGLADPEYLPAGLAAELLEVAQQLQGTGTGDALAGLRVF